jgi:hypothetical protein
MVRLFLVLLLLAAPVSAQKRAPKEPEAVGEAGGLIVSGVAVDASGKTDVDARRNGWREAQRLAWPLLWARLSGLAPSTAPRLADGALDGIVSAIEVEREAVGGRRYVARLTVVFDRVRAASYLGRFGSLVQSPPLLVLPVLQDAGVRTGLDPESPWVKAWIRFRAGESTVDYVRLRASPADTLLLSAWQAERPSIQQWRGLMDRYQTADVLVPEFILDRTVVGGPVSGLLVARFGPGAREVGRVSLSEPSGRVDLLLDRAVREADALYAAALRSGLLVPTQALSEEPEVVEVPEMGPEFAAATGGVSIRYGVETPDNAALAAIEARLRSAAGISGVRVESFVIGGRSVLVMETALAGEALALALDRAGLRIEGDLLRLRRPDEAPLVPTVAPEAGAAPAEGAVEDVVEEAVVEGT